MNYTQRGEVVIEQIVWCQLYNTGFLSFQIVINRDQRLTLTKLVPSIKTLVETSSPRLALMLFAFSNNLLQSKITPIYAMKKRTFVVKI